MGFKYDCVADKMIYYFVGHWKRAEFLKLCSMADINHTNALSTRSSQGSRAKLALEMLPANSPLRALQCALAY